MHDDDITTLSQFSARFPNSELLDRIGPWERWYNGEGEGSNHEFAWFCEDLIGDPYDYHFQLPPCDDEFWYRGEPAADPLGGHDDPNHPATVAAREKARAGLANIL